MRCLRNGETMTYWEIRRKYFNIIFLAAFLLGGFWLFTAIRPADTLYYPQYAYMKPLNKAEFVYFTLVQDYQNGYTATYQKGDEEDLLRQRHRVRHLNEAERKRYLQVIRKINPAYRASEKKEEVRVQLTYAQIRPLLRELEKHMSMRSYYSVLDAPVHETTDGRKVSESPYRLYTKEHFRGRSYEAMCRAFAQTRQHGIDCGYARAGMEPLGVILGVLTLLGSFSVYSEEKRVGINDFLYTGNRTSGQIVMYKYLAGVLPVLITGLLYALLEAACFMAWNQLYHYGYSVSALPFLWNMLWMVSPVVLVIAALAQVMGLLFGSELTTIVVQLCVLLLSAVLRPGQFVIGSLLVHPGAFDRYRLYRDILGQMIVGRVLYLLLTAGMLALSVRLFGQRRKAGTVSDLVNGDTQAAGTSVEQTAPGSRRRRRGSFQRQEKDAGASEEVLPCDSAERYLFRQSVSRGIWFYIAGAGILIAVSLVRHLGQRQVVMLGENVLVFASFFLFIRLAGIERRSGMEGLIWSVNRSYTEIYMTRVAAAAGILFALIEIPLLLLCVASGSMPGRWCLGIYISALFLGLLALTVSELLEHRLAGYFAYIMYYLFCWIWQEGMPFSIAGYTYGIRYTKLWLSVGCLVFAAALGVITTLQSKGIRLLKKYEFGD